MRRRSYVLALATKPRDPTLQAVIDADGWRRVRSFDDVEPTDARVVVWPRLERPADVDDVQQPAIADALDGVFIQGSWAVWIDETPYVIDTLGLARPLTLLWRQGRALDVSVIACGQRPRFMPLDAYSQCRHLLLWKTSDGADLKRLDDISAAGDVDTGTVRDVVRRLPRHAFLHVDTHTGRLAVSQAPPP